MLAVVISDSQHAPLAPSEDEAFRRLAIDDTVDPATDRAVLSVLARIHRLHALRCDCAGSAEEAPLACAVRLPSGELTMRWYNGVAHANGCPFWRPAPTHPPSDRASRRPPLGGRQYRPWTGQWSILGEAISRARLGGAAPPEPQAPSAKLYTELPRLGRVLLSALHRCGYDHVSVHDLVDKGPPAALHPDRWAKRIFRLLDEPVAEGLYFKDTSTLRLANLRLWLDTLLPRAAPRFGRVRPHGVLIDRVDRIEQLSPREAVLQGFGGDPTATQRVACTVRHFGAASVGPYWVILLAGRAGEGDPFEVIDAYSHPLYRNELPVPVDSDYERTMLEVLLDQMRFWKRYPKTAASVALSKPLFDLEAPLGPCRPDAVLAMASAQGTPLQLLVECMGSADADYLAAKQVTHPRMLSLPHVVGLVQYHPDLADADFRRTLTRSLFHSARTISA